MSNKDTISIGRLNEIGNEFTIICKSKEDIINELNLNEINAVKCNSIIDNLEETMAEGVKNNKCVMIPTIAKAEKSITSIVAKEHYEEMIKAKETLSKTQYRNYVADMVNKQKEKAKEERDHKKLLNSFKKKVFPKYLKILKLHGETYARAWLLTRRKYDIVEFDEELELAYAEVYNREYNND